ncbi:hypothetical protein AOQ72_02785 [Bradyrhizobium yuanmingense]|uniref:Uncharacterized protein n=1 Tax=Bradyrhizobium yuanmingense TaxID=108015 RepID=A0A0R3BRG3_9BRAD|nr:hypothetical protein AOQ72_02785 [Bradyrhizobium yuanmingense]
MRVAEVAHLLTRDAAPEKIRALIPITISEIETAFAATDRLQAPTRSTCLYASEALVQAAGSHGSGSISVSRCTANLIHFGGTS